MTPNQGKKKVIQGESLQGEQTFESQFGRWYLDKESRSHCPAVSWIVSFIYSVNGKR